MVTNKEFGRKVGCHHSMASRIRAGKRLPSVEMMNRIAEAYPQVTVNEMVQARLEGGAEAVAMLLRRRVFRDLTPEELRGAA